MLSIALRRCCAAGLALLALWLLAGCSPLPKDWPIKELNLPPDSHKAEVPHRINDLRINLTQLPEVGKQMDQHPKWEIAFNNDGGWERVVAHVSGKLLPLGYTVWEPSKGWQGASLMLSLTGATTLGEAAVIYKTPDGPYTVTLLNVRNISTKLTDGGDEEGDFVIDISEAAPKP